MKIINIKEGELAKKFIKRMSEQQLKAELQLASKTFKEYGGIEPLEAMILIAEELKKRNISCGFNWRGDNPDTALKEPITFGEGTRNKYLRTR